MWRICFYKLLILLFVSTGYCAGFNSSLWDEDVLFGVETVKFSIRGEDYKYDLGPDERRLIDLAKAFQERSPIDLFESFEDQVLYKQRSAVIDLKAIVNYLMATKIFMNTNSMFNSSGIMTNSQVSWTAEELLEECNLPDDYLDETPYIKWNDKDNEYSYWHMTNIISKLTIARQTGRVIGVGPIGEDNRRYEWESARLNHSGYKSSATWSEWCYAGIAVYPSGDETCGDSPGTFPSWPDVDYSSRSSIYEFRGTANSWNYGYNKTRNCPYFSEDKITVDFSSSGTSKSYTLVHPKPIIDSVEIGLTRGYHGPKDNVNFKVNSYYEFSDYTRSETLVVNRIVSGYIAGGLGPSCGRSSIYYSPYNQDAVRQDVNIVYRYNHGGNFVIPESKYAYVDSRNYSSGTESLKFLHEYQEPYTVNQLKSLAVLSLYDSVSGSNSDGYGSGSGTYYYTQDKVNLYIRGGIYLINFAVSGGYDYY